jgi:hypothetical protein
LTAASTSVPSPTPAATRLRRPPAADHGHGRNAQLAVLDPRDQVDAVPREREGRPCGCLTGDARQGDRRFPKAAYGDAGRADDVEGGGVACAQTATASPAPSSPIAWFLTSRGVPDRSLAFGHAPDGPGLSFAWTTRSSPMSCTQRIAALPASLIATRGRFPTPGRPTSTGDCHVVVPRFTRCRLNDVDAGQRRRLCGAVGALLAVPDHDRVSGRIDGELGPERALRRRRARRGRARSALRRPRL